MIRILRLGVEADRGGGRAIGEAAAGSARVDSGRIDGRRGSAEDFGRRGPARDAALVESARRFDDPEFSANQIRVSSDEMKQAVGRVSGELLGALRRAISQVREYQEKVMPKGEPSFVRGGGGTGMRFTPLDSAGLYFPGGKASYPSTLIMLAVPAQVAGVKRIVVCSPASKFGRSDLVLAACAELGLTEVFRAGGAAAIGAMAFGTATIPAVDKIVGPGNRYVQLAKRCWRGAWGSMDFWGPARLS